MLALGQAPGGGDSERGEVPGKLELFEFSILFDMIIGKPDKDVLHTEKSPTLLLAFGFLCGQKVS